MKRPAKTTPLGKPLDDDDASLDMLALVTPEDVALAQADGRAKMGRLGKSLLEAQRAEEPPRDEPLPL